MIVSLFGKDGTEKQVPVALHGAARPSSSELGDSIGMILTHGGGGDMDSPHMQALVSGLTGQGMGPIVSFSSAGPLEYRTRVYEASGYP